MCFGSYVAYITLFASFPSGGYVDEAFPVSDGALLLALGEGS